MAPVRGHRTQGGRSRFGSGPYHNSPVQRHDRSSQSGSAHFAGLKKIYFGKTSFAKLKEFIWGNERDDGISALATKVGLLHCCGREEAMARLGSFLLRASILVAMGWVWFNYVNGYPIGAVSAQAGIMVLIGIALYALTGVPPS